MKAKMPRQSTYARNPEPVFPLVKRPQLALALGWNAITISRLEAIDGLPVAVKGDRGRSTIYSLPAVLAWRVEREIKRRLQPGDGGGVPLDLDGERAKLANVQTRRAELTVQRLQGEVIPLTEAASVIIEMFGAVKERILSLPAALAEPLTAAAVAGGPRATERALREAVVGALKELSSWRPPWHPAAKQQDAAMNGARGGNTR
jgi:phage terminase Nu1 subunit (DNA packaging protein)